MESTRDLPTKPHWLHQLGQRGRRSASSRVAADGGDSASPSLPRCAFLQLVNNLYRQPSDPDGPLSSQLSDGHISQLILLPLF